MPGDPTDLDALDYINRLANAAGRNVHELLAEIAKTAEAALRARLAPTTQSWVKETCADCRNQFVLTPFRCVTCSSERLNALELRTARQTAADATARAEAAERALAECRDLVSRALRRMSRGENSMSILTQLAQEAEALKAKEPRDA